jgi:RNA polymerase primary sigma factor
MRCKSILHKTLCEAERIREFLCNFFTGFVDRFLWRVSAAPQRGASERPERHQGENMHSERPEFEARQEPLLMQSESTGTVRLNEIEAGRSDRQESARRSKRADKVRRSEIQPYVSSIRYGKVLSASEETSLAEAIAQGDRDALSRLVQSNLGLVVKIAQDYTGQGVTIDDLIGEGNLSLIRAAEQYQPVHGVRFSTYASIWIKKSMRHAVLTSSAIIRVPMCILTMLWKLRKAERALARELGSTPTFDEVAACLGLSELQKSRLARARLARRVQHESTDVRDRGGWSSADALDPYGPPGLEDDLPDDRAVLESRLERLDEREKLVLCMRHGLGGVAPMKLSAIARCLGLTKECVRTIEHRAARKLRREVAPVESELTGGPGGKERGRQSRKVEWRRGKSSMGRSGATPGSQLPRREAGGAALSRPPIREQRPIPPPYLNGSSPNP